MKRSPTQVHDSRVGHYALFYTALLVASALTLSLASGQNLGGHGVSVSSLVRATSGNRGGSAVISFENPEVHSQGLSQSVASVQQTLDLVDGSIHSGNYRPSVCNEFEDVATAPALGSVFVTCLASDLLLKLNATSGTLQGIAQVGPGPMGLVFDPNGDRVYVANFNGGSGGGGVDVIDASSMSLIAKIIAGCSPVNVALDAASNNIYVSDFCNDNITVISGVNDSVIENIPLRSGSEPLGIAYDPINRNVYVAVTAYGQLGVISTTNNSLEAAVSVSGEPTELLCNPVTGNVYVALGFQGIVEEISGSNNTILANATFPSYTPGPSGLALDTSANRLFVTTYNVTIMNASTLSLIRWINVGSGPIGIGFDNVTDYVYVADFSSNDLALINASTSTVVDYFHGDPEPAGVAWSGASQDVYVTEEASGALIQVDAKTHAILSSNHLAYGIDALTTDSADGDLFVADGNNNRIYQTSPNEQVMTSALVGDNPTGLAYDANNGLVYIANFASDNLSLLRAANSSYFGSISLAGPVLGGGGSEDVTFDPTDGDLFVSVQGSVFGGGIPGNVTVINGTDNQVIGGIYDWVEPGPTALAVDTENNVLYVTDDYANLLWAFNASTWSFITAVPVGDSPQGLVVDSQTGLVYVTNSDSNNVSVIDSATNRVLGSISVGVTPMGVAFDPTTGDIYVANMGSGTLSILGYARYSVSLQEFGLPTGTMWNVTLGGVSNSSTTSSIGFTEQNGSYPYAIAGISGWHLVSFPRIGSVTVNGSSLEEVVNWTVTTYTVRFTESGLSLNAVWNVTLGGVLQSTSTSTVAFSVMNESYLFSVGAPPGYTVHPSTGSLLVNGTNVTESLTFTKTPTSTFLGLPVVEGYGLVAAVVVVGGLVVAFLVVRVRHRKQQSPEPLSVH